MIEHRHLKKIDSYVLGWGVTLCLLAVPFWERSIFFGMLIGAFIASVNWVGFRYLMMRIVEGRNRARYGFLLALKTVLILGAVAVVVMYIPIHTIAFVVGISSLVLGIFTYSLLFALSSNESALKEDL